MPGFDTSRLTADLHLLSIILPIAVGLFMSWLVLIYIRELRWERERRRALAERLRREGR